MGGIRGSVWVKFRLTMVALAMISIVCGGSAFATSANCTTVSAATSATPPAYNDILLCVFDTLGVYAVIAALLVVILPLVLIVWGSRSGMSLISSLFRKAAGALGRH